ncbi:helix-turn-helix domain-containing protein [Flavitalea sp.]|nr:helix-turn-helix domain-containing protein [Flavitalea sp.]
MSLASLNLYGTYKNWFNSNVLTFITQLLPLVIVMPVGPLIYFYVQSFIDSSFKFNGTLKKHFYPLIIDLVPSLLLIIYIGGVTTGTLTNNPVPWGIFIDNYNVYADVPRWISVSYYVWLSAKYLSKVKEQVNVTADHRYFGWLHNFIRVFLVFQTIWLLYLIPYIIPRYTDWMLNTFGWYPVFVPLAILIYWMGIKGYIMSYTIRDNDKKTKSKTILNVESINPAIEALRKSMEEDKAFLDPAINLTLLAERTGISSRTISMIVNQYFQKSFNEYINEYRVEEFKKRVLHPELSHFTISGIASDCGFNSQATFQRTFKDLTGMSPSQFKKSASSFRPDC